MLKQYVVNTFTDQVFTGNPAAVCILDHWPEDRFLLLLARENALSHTAFLLPLCQDQYEMRWFTPQMEIDLCGHATLAAAYVLTKLIVPNAPELHFQTKAGPLHVRKQGELLEMDFPAYQLKQLEVTQDIVDALGVRPTEVWRARDLVCVFDDPEVIVNMNPDQEKLLKVKGALMQVTAPGRDGFDCISRTFAPKMNLPEDPVCGSGHCHIIPYWANRWNKTEFVARQASQRGGTLYCRMEGDRVCVAGKAALYSVCDLVMEGWKP